MGDRVLPSTAESADDAHTQSVLVVLRGASPPLKWVSRQPAHEAVVSSAGSVSAPEKTRGPLFVINQDVTSSDPTEVPPSTNLSRQNILFLYSNFSTHPHDTPKGAFREMAKFLRTHESAATIQHAKQNMHPRPSMTQPGYSGEFIPFFGLLGDLL